MLNVNVKFLKFLKFRWSAVEHHINMRAIMLGCSFILCGGSTFLGAQEWTPADTGRMSPAYRDLSRYTPGMCVTMIRNARELLWRRFEDDTAESRPERDTLPTAVLALGKQCAARYTVDSLAPRDLWNLHRLSILIADDQLEQKVLARRLSLAVADTGRGEVLLEAIESHFDARPLRFSAVETLLARLDSLGDGAAIARVLAHHKLGMLATYYKFDTAVAQREVRAVRSLRTALTPAEQAEFVYEVSGVGPATKVAWYRVSDTTLSLTIDTIFEEGAQGLSPQARRILNGIHMIAKSSAIAVGWPAPPVKGAYWFNDPASGVARPQRGKVTLITNLNNDALPRLTMLRRLHEKYSASGLEIILVAETDGFSWASPPQSLNNEVNTLAWYYLEHLQLPMTLLVDTSAYKVDATGRRLRQPTNFSTAYSKIGSARGLIGRDGKIRSVTFGSNWPEIEVEAFIKQALAEKVEP